MLSFFILKVLLEKKFKGTEKNFLLPIGEVRSMVKSHMNTELSEIIQYILDQAPIETTLI